MKQALAIATCTAIMALYCTIGSFSSGHPADELVRMIGLILAIDYTWRRIMNSKTIDGPSQRQP
jgi:hypothetical protein